MLKAPRPQNETQRLSSLRRLGLLDTAAEERFDRITRMAQRLFAVKSCLISFIDADRQWCKSQQGFEGGEIVRDEAFCAHAILVEDVFVVGDASADPRFEDSPLVTGSHAVRFYAGCPVRSPDGERVGTLALLDDKPRGFPPADKAVLRDLAALVEDELRVTTQLTVDTLTGLANARGFATVAGHLLSLCRRSSHDAELLLFTLERCSDEPAGAAGDTWNHSVRAFANLLQLSFRAADVVARLGENEFVVLLAAAGSGSESALQRVDEMASLAAAKDDGGNGDDARLLARIRWKAGSARFDALRHESVNSLVEDVRAGVGSSRAGEGATLRAAAS